MKQFFGNELTLPCYSSFSSLFFGMNFSDWKQRPDDLWPRVDNKWQAIQSGAACKMFFSWCQACEDVILYLVPCCLICLHSACYFYADWEPVLPRSLLDPFGFWQISIAKFSIPQYLVGGFKQFLFSHNIWRCHPSQLTNSIIFQDVHIAPPSSATNGTFSDAKSDADSSL